ncbi:ABC transporter ATP-binding protein [Rubrimonas cliftonensis]|uniref:Peptide/nickel transport system ATP-binding protein n=1 Tax=Rubrimonas cliftonensis TaxID=89524 RepID=A0A1H4EAU0_9RHOB|nr:ABC transporter ATP-binding protein [Rubrimonas cliftonensis]SEA82145.1 peptide/nickel transport system ATP-binding protein [Rubrimonas cliftonensis]
MSGPLLDIRGLHVALPPGSDRAFAVEDVSFTVGEGEIVCVVGESGSGKSLTARAVMGLLPEPKVRASAGRIDFEGRDLLTLPPSERRALRGERLSMIFQEPMTALNPLMTVGRQIEEVLIVHAAKLTAAQRREKILALLDEVRLPDPPRMAASFPHQLSGGQRQRAMIAMALILDPKLLVADEPTTALDVTTQAQILRLIAELQARHGAGVMFITHDFGVVAEIAHRIVVMQHGRVVEAGTADSVLNRPAAPYTRALIAAIPSLTPAPRRPATSARTALRVTGLGKTYRMGGGLFSAARAVHAAKAVSFELKRGETMGIVGESGSGKTTVARCLVRLLKPDAGSIDLDGVDLAPLSRGALRPYRKRVQMVFQDPFASLNPRRTIGDILAEGPIVHGLAPAKARARARDLLGLVGLDPKVAERYPHEFSGGQRQRVGIARALALEPEVLVADEPVSALDVSVQAQVLRLIADIRERLGLSIVFITHDLRVAAQVCDRVAVMHRGEVVEQGVTAEVFAAPRHAYTRELFASVPGRDWIAPALDAPDGAAAQ